MHPIIGDRIAPMSPVIFDFTRVTLPFYR